MIKNLKILCVNYYPLERDRIGRLISADPDVYFYETFFADNFDEAKIILKNQNPDLVLIDDCMDQGPDLCKFIRAHEGERHTGIVFTTTKPLKLMKEHRKNSSIECLEVGADDFIRMDSSDRELYARLKAVLKLKTMADELRRVNHTLEQLSLTDDLTGLANMRFFYKEYAKSITNLERGMFNVGVLVFDIDHFKSINDNLDHLAGSYILSYLGKVLRETDINFNDQITARFGGDEFIILINNVSYAQITEYAEKLRKLIEDTVIDYQGNIVRLTVSVGVSWAEAGYVGGQEKLIKLADHQLYKSKHLGRNKVSTSELNEFDDSKEIQQGALVYNQGLGKFDN